MTNDLLTNRFGCDGYYFGTNEDFSRHTDFVRKLTVNVDRDRYYFGTNELFPGTPTLLRS